VRLFIALLVAVTATACTTVQEPSLPVHVVWQNVDDVQAACEEVSGRREVFRVLGCSKWRDIGGQRTCTIYAQAPRDERDVQRFATLGHELMHCTDGNWHDKWGRMTDSRVRQARASDQPSNAAAGASSAPRE